MAYKICTSFIVALCISSVLFLAFLLASHIAPWMFLIVLGFLIVWGVSYLGLYY